jgi:TldD protein
MSEHAMRNIHRSDPWKSAVKNFGKRDPRDVAPSEKVEFVRHYFGIAKNFDSRIINASSSYREIIDERAFVNSEGSELSEILSRVYFAVTAIARENDRMEYDYCSDGRTGGFELLDNIINDESVKQTAKSAVELLSSHQVPTGEFSVVLDPGMTGTFAHESFGHGCEADQVLRGRSYLVNYIDKKMGPENLDLYDDGTWASGVGSIAFDDEGNPPHKTPIVENGVLKHFMHDRTSSEEMHDLPTGNARRESYKRMIYVRMTNTYIGPGDYELDELLRTTRNGILLEHWNSGIEDPIGGNMQLKCKKSRRIKDGELGESFSTTVLSGKVVDFVSSISGMTKEKDFQMGAGFCGKGREDHVTVGSGGTFLASRATIGQG